jgi:hypothetical protein
MDINRRVILHFLAGDQAAAERLANVAFGVFS